MVAIDGKDSTIAISFYPRFFYPDSTNELFGLEAEYKFKVFNLKRFLVNKEKYSMPDTLMASLYGVVISGTRGMLAALNTTQEYRRIYMPFIDPKSFKAAMKQSEKRADPPNNHD